METRILVCCATTDKTSAEETCKRLAGAGLNIEIVGVPDGDTPGLEDSMESFARFVLVFFSSQWASESEALNKNLEIALQSAHKIAKNRVFIIPVRLDKCDVPESVDHLQLIDLFEEGGFDQIVEVIREELSLFTDSRDGQVYKTIDIAGVTWLAENLNYEVEHSWWYDNEPGNGRPFGRLYTWEAARVACPSGWHIPTVADWEQLAASVGGTWDFAESAAAYKALIEESGGFHAVLGGLHEKRPFDAFYEKGQSGIYWGGSAQDGIYTFIFGGKVGRLASFQANELENGHSCRCVKDS